jgi:hypothetical protein
MYPSHSSLLDSYILGELNHMITEFVENVDLHAGSVDKGQI